jgi:hypothetical protein
LATRTAPIAPEGCAGHRETAGSAKTQAEFE